MAMQPYYLMEIEGLDGFILDTDLLDYDLLGYLAQDVSSYVLSVDIKRGKSTELDRFPAGTMKVNFDNRTRMFDPDSNSGNPWQGFIKPRRRITLYGDTELADIHLYPIFSGYVDSWTYSYDVSGQSIATANCSDLFTVLAGQSVTLTSPTAEKSDDRFRRVLTNSAVAIPVDEFNAIGAAFTMNNVSYTGNALDYLQKIATSENAFLFVNQAGEITFLGWNYWQTQAIVLRFGWDLSTKYTPFTNIQLDYETTQLANYVSVQSAAGTAIAQDFTSQLQNQIASTSIDVLTNNVPQMQVLADLIIAKYKDPMLRVSSITLSGSGLGAESTPTHDSLGAIMDVDIGFVTELNWIPNNTGGQFQRFITVSGKSWRITPEDTEITLEFLPLDERSNYG